MPNNSVLLFIQPNDGNIFIYKYVTIQSVIIKCDAN